MVRAAFGTQTVGSVIRPAAYCGVVGFKPTHNLVPLAGIAGLSPSFDTLGWFTHSVADAATMLQALAAVEPIAGSKQPRVGVYRSHQWPSAEPEMADTLARAAARLRGGGFDVVTIDPLPHLDTVFQAADTILHFEVARVLAWERHNHWDLISPLVQRMLLNADKVGAVEHARCRRVLEHARREHDTYLINQGLDALVTPSAPGEAPPIKTTGNSVFNRTWTSLAVPSIHLPTGSGPTGLPVGVQLTGTRWGDAELLAVAANAELVLGSNE
jgi:Asp-tRNA(Asn)/Glu-tRNA(Gln) amidotransferase A subunit family amidase